MKWKMECVDVGIIFTGISAGGAATAAIFSFLSIKENRKNIFLLEKNKAALAARQIKLDFSIEGVDYRISDHLDDKHVLFSSKYFMDRNLYDKITTVLVKLHRLENERKAGTECDARKEEIARELDAIVCDVRLDKWPNK